MIKTACWRRTNSLTNILLIPKRRRSATTFDFGSRKLSIPKRSPAELPGCFVSMIHLGKIQIPKPECSGDFGDTFLTGHNHLWWLLGGLVVVSFARFSCTLRIFYSSPPYQGVYRFPIPGIEKILFREIWILNGIKSDDVMPRKSMSWRWKYPDKNGPEKNCGTTPLYFQMVRSTVTNPSFFRVPKVTIPGVSQDPMRRAKLKHPIHTVHGASILLVPMWGS